MLVTLTVLDRRTTGQPHRHVTIEASAGTSFGAVRARVGAVTGLSAAQLRVGDRLVADDDLLGHPPLLRGALLVAGPADRAGGPTGGMGAVELRLVSGSGAGRLVVLGRGQHVIGRAASAGVRLDDPGVSRAHAVLSVSTDGLYLRDLQPTNPSRLDGVALPVAGARVTTGQHLRIGSTTVVVGQADVRAGHHEIVGGEVRIHRQPRIREAATTPPVVFPEAPRRPEHGRVPLLASLAPLALSGILAVVLSSPALLLFALMSPVLLLGQWWSDRRAGRTSYRRQLREHASQLERARKDLLDSARRDALRRRGEQPDLAYVEAVVRRRGTRLWERRPADGDYLRVRVGTATQPAEVHTSGPAGERPQIEDLPALLDLQGVVGVAGPHGHASSLAGALLVQVAAWHTPRAVTLHILADTEERARQWEWAAHLPHARGGEEEAARISGGAAAVASHAAALRALVESRRGTSYGHRPPPGASPPVDTLVLADGASALRAVPGFSELLRGGPDAGVALVCLDRDVASLPVEASATLEIEGSGLGGTIRQEGNTIEGVVPDLPSPGWLETVSRTMSPYVDATPEMGAGTLPARVSFVGLHRAAGTDALSADSLAQAWSRSSGRPVALLGLDAEGEVSIDLAADGPHALVGGTTGSGKSELLQSLVAGLAVTSPPDELSFVLVDYKGGSAFSECARLPHTVGLVTDLDAHLTARALVSLDAEMKRRERLLAQAGARDLHEYRRAAGVCPDLAPLARLVIVVDEFKALAEEFPDFIDGLVRVAALGRSLGLHLVLATQRPAGIVSADMRANVALRIALRVRDRSDSEDVVDCADAASLDPRTPGRACIRAGDHGLRTVQTAYIGGGLARRADEAMPVRVVARDLLTALPAAPASSSEDLSRGCGTELDAYVAASRAAARQLDLRTASQPWLPPLQDVLTTAELSRWADDEDISVDATSVPLGLVDLPHRQRQESLHWRPEHDGHLGIAGGPRSGRSTSLVNLALGLVRRHSPQRLHLHVLQGVSGPAAALGRLPHVGTVTDATDPGIIRRLVSRLLGLVDGEETGPDRVVVLVDGWESLEESLSDHGSDVDDLHRLLRDGPSAGVWFAVAGGRALLSGRLPGLLQRRLVLSMPDPLDLTLAGLPPAQTSTTLPPGRAIDLRSGNYLQLAVPGADASAAATAAAVDAAAGALESASGAAAHAGEAGETSEDGQAGEGGEGGEDAGDADAAGDTVGQQHTAGPGPGRAGRVARSSAPWRITALPAHVPLEGLSPGGEELVLGLGGDEAGPVGLTPGPGRRRFLVAGPNRSGRSTVLTTTGERLAQQGRHVVVLCPRRSPLSSWAGSRRLRTFTTKDVAEVVEVRRADPDLCVLVDDVELVDGSPVEVALVELVRLVDDTDGFIAVAAELTRANGAFRGLVPEVARNGCGLILGATSPSDGDVLGVRLEVPAVRRPGRGELVVDGGTVPTQVARLDPDRPLPPLPIPPLPVPALPVPALPVPAVPVPAVPVPEVPVRPRAASS
ncbi:hypothetical protein GCM10009740_14480 [Terrabacter terrae]|uniref:S-DNA-T family DNA segregation ATPase FtsK/SpoIIIE n=1 Tax=Terrabacter terrae TaxID=318434 RepID=A0ABN2TZ92_9MICO